MKLLSNNLSYTGNDLVADVSYDAFLSTTDSTTATHEYEIMIWLAAYGGIEPIGNWRRRHDKSCIAIS